MAREYVAGAFGANVLLRRKRKADRITGSNGDQLDEFRYDEQGRMTQIRHVPARPERANTATGIGVCFEAISEGDTLTDGGTVETSYNERGQLVERRIVDDASMLLFRIVHLYDANGRLGEERLVSENPSLPKAFRDQIPGEQRAAVLAQIKMKFESIGRQSGLFGNAERAYVYDNQGRRKTYAHGTYSRRSNVDSQRSRGHDRIDQTDEWLPP